jgi:type IV secretion system protein VirB9
MKKYLNNFQYLLFFLALNFGLSLSAHANSIPLTSDSRIKTFVYSANDVFQVTVSYGFQASIEFGRGEHITTISMGSRHAWNVRPMDDRIFLRPIEADANTNMTVITNKRTYQFDLSSKLESEASTDEQVYVVRFFYPDSNFDQPRANFSPSGFSSPMASTQPLNFTNNIPTAQISQTAAPNQIPVPTPRNSSPTATWSENYNYDYTFTGPERIAPEKIFDDGQKTFFRFANGNALIPHIFVTDKLGDERRLNYSVKGEYVIVEERSAQFSLRLGKELVCVFNESLRHQNQAQQSYPGVAR